MRFNVLKKAVQEQFNKMSNNEIFTTATDKDEIWSHYLGSFPDGADPMFRERTEHNCSCCKQFIRACGNMVVISDGKLVSIWDVNVGGKYQPVADAMSEYVKSFLVTGLFRNPEKKVGTDFNMEIRDDSPMRWEHFYLELPSKFVMSGSDIGTYLSETASNKSVFLRSLDEISIQSAETVIELINQNSIYRGEEFRSTVQLFIKHKKAFNEMFGGKGDLDMYCWSESAKLGGASKIRNTVIGTLMDDLSNDIDLNEAVKMFESKVAPENYKRPTALITKSMIDSAQNKVAELGLGSSLGRRYATARDLTINNVIFADRSVKPEMSVFNELKEDIQEKIKTYDHVDEVSVQKFIKDILPTAEGIEVMVENRHERNLMSLVSPLIKEAPGMFKWGNAFSWGYNGDVADSMRQHVSKAGGSVDGVLRFSIMWNDGDDNQNDFDAHCIEPSGNLISFPKAGRMQTSSGILDIDIQNPGSKVAVENITWSDISKMQNGNYEFIVHNYRHNGGRTGFTAEIEYDGKIYFYKYDKELRQGEKVLVAKVDFSKTSGLKIIKSLTSSVSTKEIWGMSTNKFHKAKMILNSPNHWDGEKTGNKHLFFILEDCLNPGNVRGFYNEFLKEDLQANRKVFEILGGKMRAQYSDNQLSGVGFSTTKRDSVLCRVSGNFKRVVKIIL